MRLKTNDTKFIKYLILPLLIFIFFFNFYAYYVTKVPIRFWDEHGWIGRSYFFGLFIKRDFNNPVWQTYYSYDQAKLADYLYGLILYPDYLREKNNIKDKKYDMAKFLIDNNFYQIHSPIYERYKQHRLDFIKWGSKPFEDFDVSPQYLINKYGQGFIKTINIIFTARRVNVFVLAASMVTIYFITLMVFGRLVALLTVLFYGLNNLVVTASLRAHSEGIFLLLFNLGILLLLIIFGQNKKNHKTLLLFSLISGLLTQTKLNGIIILAFFNFLIILIILRALFDKNYLFFKKSLLKLLIVNLISFVIFVSLHPFLYRSPIKNTLYMYQWRRDLAEKQEERPSYKLSSFRERIRKIYTNFLGKEDSINYNNIFIFREFIKRKKDFLSILNTFLFLLGMSISFVRLIGRKRLTSPLVVLTVFFILVQIMMGFYLKINYDRYYIQLVFFFVLFQSIGFYHSIKFLLKYLFFCWNYFSDSTSTIE